MSVSYYIYYRVAKPDLASALVRNIQTSLRSSTGIAGRLLRRRDDPATWMEIYEGVEQATQFESCLNSVVQAADFGAVLERGAVRTMECFEETCA